MEFKPLGNDSFYLLDYRPRSAFADQEKYYQQNRVLLSIKSSRKNSNRFFQTVQQVTAPFHSLFQKQLKYFNSSLSCIIPLPGSKKFSLKLFSPVSAMAELCAEGIDILFLDILRRKYDIPSSHLTNIRIIDDHLKSIEIEQNALNKLLSMRTVILFDDIYTTGTTFKACVKIIKDAGFTGKILGIFVGRDIQ